MLSGSFSIFVYLLLTSRWFSAVYYDRSYVIHPVTVESRLNWDIRTSVCEIRINNTKFFMSLKRRISYSVTETNWFELFI
jgi:hypothetical protein